MKITKETFYDAYREWVEHKLIECIARGHAAEVDGPTKTIFKENRDSIVKAAGQHRDFNRGLRLDDVILQRDRIIPVLIPKESLTV